MLTTLKEDQASKKSSTKYITPVNRASIIFKGWDFEEDPNQNNLSHPKSSEIEEQGSESESDGCSIDLNNRMKAQPASQNTF